VRLTRVLHTLYREALRPIMATTTCPHCHRPITHKGGYKVQCESCRRVVYLYTQADKDFLKQRPLRIADPDKETP
jgi:uncharacterized Zn finger protein (UPF0148 family)